jgi:hypothetical protein
MKHLLRSWRGRGGTLSGLRKGEEMILRSDGFPVKNLTLKENGRFEFEPKLPEGAEVSFFACASFSFVTEPNVYLVTSLFFSTKSGS